MPASDLLYERAVGELGLPVRPFDFFPRLPQLRLQLIQLVQDLARSLQAKFCNRGRLEQDTKHKEAVAQQNAPT